MEPVPYRWHLFRHLRGSVPEVLEEVLDRACHVDRVRRSQGAGRMITMTVVVVVDVRW
jgi:ribosomal protein S5